MRIGIALSGGGLRATLFHLGVLRFLHDAKVLADVKHIAAVSGGSILAAHVALNWQRYTGSSQEFDGAAKEVLAFSMSDVRGHIFRRYLPLFPIYWFLYVVQRLVLRFLSRVSWCTTTSLLRWYYDRFLYHRACLRDFAPGAPLVELLCTNLSTGRLCAFSQLGYFDGSRYTPVNCPVALAVAASSAFPGFFVPIKLTGKMLNMSGMVPEFLTDGGVYDNLGLRRFRQLGQFDLVIVSDASSSFEWNFVTQFSMLNTVLRGFDVLLKRISDLEYESAGYAGTTVLACPQQPLAFIRIADTTDRSDVPTEIQQRLKGMRTDLDDFSKVECGLLCQHGFGVAAKVLTTKLSLARLPLWYPFRRWSLPILPTARWCALLDEAQQVQIFKWSHLRRDKTVFFYCLLLVGMVGWLVWYFLGTIL